MSDHDQLRRHGDFADMPRKIAWTIMAIERLGLPAVVIGALLYITYFNQNKMTEALTNMTTAFREVAVKMAVLDTNDHAIVENQKLILQRLK